MSDVATPMPEYDAMSIHWELPAALMGGTFAMRNAGRKYLPQEGRYVTIDGVPTWQGESNEAYQRRLNRTTLYNGFKRAIHGLRGKVFAKPIILATDAPERFEEWVENIDLQGNNLTVFAFSLFESALTYGHTHILADYPVVPKGATAADERMLRVRPYLTHVPPQNLIGWRMETVGGIRQLTQVRIRETLTEFDGDYGTQVVEQVRVLYPDRWEVYRSSEAGWELVSESPNPLGFIPLSTLYTQRTGEFISEPPLLDLAYKNVEHWQSSSDQKNILHVARVPILFGRGFVAGDRQVEIGSSQMVVEPDPQADLKYVEHSGAAIESGQKDLDIIESQMLALSLEPMIQRTGNVTATARALDEAEANSSLQAWALRMQDALDNALYYMDAWAGYTDGAAVDVNTSYGLTLDKTDDVKALIQLRGLREISRQTLMTELKRRGTLDDEYDLEEDTELLDNETGIGL